MKERFEKVLKKMSCTAFDVAAAPMYIVIFGVPALLIAAVGLICFFAVRKIIKISKEKKTEGRQ